MAASPIISEEAQLVINEIAPERNEFEKALAALTGLNGTELAQAGRLGERRITWVKEIDQQAAIWFKRVGDRLAPGKKKAYEAWREWTKLEEELTAPAKSIRDRARPLIGQYQLELNHQADIEAARLREVQRKAQEEQRQAQEEEAAKLRAAAEALAAEGDTAAAEEKQLEASFVESEPIVPVAVTAEQLAPKKIDAGRVIYWRKVANFQLFLNWLLKQPPEHVRAQEQGDDTNETVFELFDYTVTIRFGASWKSKDLAADIPGVSVTRGYESRQGRSRR